ncbi:MAG: isocitrate lyase/phosphoenolpyruvate mutase family protein [Maricaulaceae bacterium]|jgi:2-methylisocitrate lyase-like PEP mutase family enzyme
MTPTETFRALHAADAGFIMPNAWDVGSALILADAGFAAIATTSAGIAFSMGRQDYAGDATRWAVTREEMLARAADIAKAVSIPVNVDLEAGYGDRPQDVAETVRMAIDAGLAGGNIEDRIPGKPALYDETLVVERIVAAREAIDAANSAFVLTARSDAIVWPEDGIDAAIRRSNAYRAAGADCLFTPGVSDLPSITRLAREIDGPLNMVLGLGDAQGNAREWLAAGVHRISLGGSIARSALGLVRRAAAELRDQGTITFAEDQLPQPEINALFARVRAS